MDTSKEYIKMCKKAVEIQDMVYGEYSKELQYGDFIGWFPGGNQQVEVVLNMTLDKSFRKSVLKQTWLPRQDQLQEMVIDEYEDYPIKLGGLLLNFHFFTGQKDDLTSMEQLWLAFVMKEKYNKTWNGEDWKQ